MDNRDIITEEVVIKEIKPDMDKVKKLSEHLLLKFDTKKNCKHCYGKGVEISQLSPNSDIIYTPCICLKAL